MNRPSFLDLPRPVVTCILCGRSVEEDISIIKNGEFENASAFAVHMEGLDDALLTEDTFRRLANATAKPVMLLRYRGNDHWPSGLNDDERVERLLLAAKCGASAIDFTADTFDPSPLEFSDKPEIIDKQRCAIDRAHEYGAEVIMSSHIYQPRTCEQVLEHMKAVEKRGCDIAKIVTIADTEEQFVDAVNTTLQLRKEMKVPFIHLVGGKFALPHRYLSPMLGNMLTFCVTSYTKDYITTQPPIKNMLNILNSVNWNINQLDIRKTDD